MPTPISSNPQTSNQPSSSGSISTSGAETDSNATLKQHTSSSPSIPSITVGNEEGHTLALLNSHHDYPYATSASPAQQTINSGALGGMTSPPILGQTINSASNAAHSPLLPLSPRFSITTVSGQANNNNNVLGGVAGEPLLSVSPIPPQQNFAAESASICASHHEEIKIIKPISDLERIVEAGGPGNRYAKVLYLGRRHNLLI